MLMTQSLRRAVQIGAQRTATIDGAERRSWAEVEERVQRLAAALRHQGVERGDRVAIIAANGARYLESYFACFWLGAVIVPLNTRWSDEELAYGLSDSAPNILIVDAQFRPQARKLLALAGLEIAVITYGDGVPDEAGFLDYEDLLAAAEPIVAVETGADDLAMLCYTGGTTGKSKGVMLSQLALWTSALAFGHEVQDLATESTVVLLIMPLFHIGGAQTMFSTVIGGGCNIFMPAFEPVTVLRAIEKEQVTHTVLVPTMVRSVLDLPDLASFDLSSLKVLVYGAAPMSQAQIQETLHKLPELKLQQGYGQTEMAPYISGLLPEAHITEGPQAVRLRSAGKAAICCEVMIADPDGKEAPRGEMGEILVRGPNMMLGYWGKPEETARTIVNGWVRTGDAGHMDEGGFIFIIDRLKDMIVSGGENIYSSEVENALATHPAVATGLVIGIPHERWGEVVHAIVQLRDGYSATAEEIIDHCRKSIAGYKLPRSVEFRTEPFPVSGAGKILKRELRKPYWQDRGSGVI